MKTKPERVYFSVGNKESKTLNPYMKTVENNTREIESFYRYQGIETIFELNSGNPVSYTHLVLAPSLLSAAVSFSLSHEKITLYPSASRYSVPEYLGVLFDLYLSLIHI